MKFPAILILMLLPLSLFAQHITGTVVDKSDELPVVFANVSSPSQVTVTSYAGTFALTNLNPGDTIKVTCIGYKPYKRVYKKAKADTVIIYLQQSSILLKDVNVKARHNFRQDSLNVRRQFSAIFDYKAPGFKDLFITRDPYVYIPYNYIDAPNSTATIFSVNLLSVIDVLSKNKAPETKLQKTLLQDEENTYVDRSFSKQKITDITNLKGDSLLNFMDDYRPTIAQAKKMSDYDMVKYIKKSYADFIKNYKQDEQSPFAH
jgi:hypothetical protein